MPTAGPAPPALHARDGAARPGGRQRGSSTAPRLAATDYAWSIAPRASAAFLGAGYVAGVVATGLVVFAAHRWRSLSMLAPALWVLSVGLLVATLLHTDKFRLDYPPTWIWIGVYALVPFGSRCSCSASAASRARRPSATPRCDGVRIASLDHRHRDGRGALALFIAPTGSACTGPGT